MIDWKKIRFTFDEPLLNHQRINAHILFTSGVHYDVRSGDAQQPSVRRAIMERLVAMLFRGVYGEIRSRLVEIQHRTMCAVPTHHDYEQIKQLFDVVFKLMEPPKLHEILREGTTRDGQGRTVLSSATPNPNPCTHAVGPAFVAVPPAFQPKRETAPSGCEAESYVDAGQ